MTNYAISVYGLDQLAISGPNPFLDQSGRNMAALNASSITLAPTARTRLVEIVDDDTHFHDATQEVGNVSRLINAETINGTTYGATSAIRNEYTYIIRQQGSSSSADNIRIHVIRLDGQIVGFAFDKPLSPGTTYNVLSGGSDQPGHAYSSYAVVCFTPGTLIDTPRGPRAVQLLRPGDLVQTVDWGPRIVTWVLSRSVAGSGINAPIHVPAGALGNTRSLILSPQHRVVINLYGEEHLLPVKALVGQRGISVQRCPTVEYFHVLCEGHQVIRAEGAAVETLLPGKMVLASLYPADCTTIRSLTVGSVWVPARPLLRPGVYRQFLARLNRTGRSRSLWSARAAHPAADQI